MDNSPIPFRSVPKPAHRPRPLPQPDNLERAFALIEEAYDRLDTAALLLLAEMERREDG